MWNAYCSCQKYVYECKVICDINNAHFKLCSVSFLSFVNYRFSLLPSSCFFIHFTDAVACTEDLQIQLSFSFEEHDLYIFGLTFVAIAIKEISSGEVCFGIHCKEVNNVFLQYSASFSVRTMHHLMMSVHASFGVGTMHHLVLPCPYITHGRSILHNAISLLLIVQSQK